MAKTDKIPTPPEIEDIPATDTPPPAEGLEALPEEAAPEEGGLIDLLKEFSLEDLEDVELDTVDTPSYTPPPLADALSTGGDWSFPGLDGFDTGGSFLSDLFTSSDETEPEGFTTHFDVADYGLAKPDFSFKPEFKTPETKAPKPSHFTSGENTKVVGTKEDETIEGDEGTDIVQGKKGDDAISGLGGDDLLKGGHGDDFLNGGTGNDTLNGGKGDDVLEYTLADNTGNVDYYDGGKGTDTLQLNMTAEEFAEHEEELAELEAWIAENADPKASQSQAFNDASSNSAKHPVFETSWGLNIRNVESLEVNISEPAPEPEPEPEPEVETVFVDLEASAEPEPTVDPVVLTPGTGSLPIESMTVSLSPDSQINVSMDVDVNELPPIFDVFMVQDLSGSFYDDLPNVQANFSSLYEGLTGSNDVQFGIGSFVDKPIEPFGESGGEYSYTYSDGSSYSFSYDPDYVYNTDLGITGDKDALQASLDGLSIYSGYDWKEAQLEALTQTALRGEEIGFREGAQKFVVLQTDAPFHQEGDYAEASEGANNYDTIFGDEDYPSVSAVGELLESAGITPIFAVADPYGGTIDAYQGLVDTWGFGYVTEITSDSSNIVSAINDGLNSVPLSLDMSVNGDDYGYVSSVTPTMYEDIGPGTYTFDITLEIPEDSSNYTSDSLSLDVTGYGSIDVAVEISRLDATGDSGADTLFGSSSGNGLFGLAGDDIIDGREGNDIIVGGLGNDTLTGGEGSDLFLFEAGDTTCTDIITDFNVSMGGDTLDFSELFASFDPNTDPVADFLQVVEDNGNTIVQVDQDGGGDGFVDVVVLEGVVDTSVDSMIDDGGIIV